MNKKKHIDPIPEVFASYEEAGGFWDTHDTTDYESIFKSVESSGEDLVALPGYWKNRSVRKLAGRRDPIAVMTEKAQDVVFAALEKGWSGPPFDPIALAGLLNIKVIPRDDVGDVTNDARIVPNAGDKFTIEYNPNKPTARLRFSICHEIAHSFFPDCAERARHRLERQHIGASDRQVEMLCNLGAAELLMPIGSFPEIAKDGYTINKVLELRRKFEVSTEAVLLRIVKLSNEPLAAFSAVAKTSTTGSAIYSIDYCVSSRAWPTRLCPGLVLPNKTTLRSCIAIGYTTEGSETWKPDMGPITIQAVAVPPYPDSEGAKLPSYYLSAKQALGQ